MWQYQVVSVAVAFILRRWVDWVGDGGGQEQYVSVLYLEL